MIRVLVVDDEPSMRGALQENFSRAGWQVETASGTEEALRLMSESPFSLVVTDMRMPDGDGLKVMRGARMLSSRTAVIFLTAYGNVPEAVEAMKSGACDYLVKPVTFERLQDAAVRVLRMASSSPAPVLAPESKPAAAASAAPEIIGRGEAMRSLMERVRQIAKTEVDVLLEAESGTGKELIARMIHASSPRRGGPFVAVNCSAFPDTLLESELFGYVKGAFTGATAQRAGKFELADGGTLLLDEVSEMPIEHQPKLLRVLQQREVDRLGGHSPVGVDVRVVATTNRDLAQMVEEGRFRADLYYRLNVVSLHLPALRNRREDIPGLVEHFVDKYAPRDRRPRFSDDLTSALVSYDWPGNVRELENIVRRILALATGPEAAIDLLEGTNLKRPPRFSPVGSNSLSLREVERQMYLKALHQTGGNRTRAAELLGVSIRTVRNKVHEFGIPPRIYA